MAAAQPSPAIHGAERLEILGDGPIACTLAHP